MPFFEAVWLGIVAILLVILSVYFQWRRTLLKDLPSFHISFPFGIMEYNNIFKFVLPIRIYMMSIIEGLAHLFSEEGMVYIKIVHKNTLLLCSPETVEAFLSDKDELKKSSMYDFAKLVMGNGLVTSAGDITWKFHRRLIVSNFSKKMLDRYQNIMSDKALILCQKLSSIRENSPINIRTLVERCMFDISMESIAGVNVNAQNNPDTKITVSTQQALDFWVEIVFNVWARLNILSPIPLTKMGREVARMVSYLTSYYRQLLLEKRKIVQDRLNRIKEGELYDDCAERPCLIEHMLAHQLTNEGSLTDQGIQDEALTVVSAGYETSGTTLAGALFLIGHNPEVQKKIHDEMEQIFGSETDRPITPTDLSKMTYLNLVIKESLRLYPTIPLIARVLQSDFELKGKLIPKGTEIIVPLGAIHKNPKHHPNPEHFIPERFLPENVKNMHPYAYIPFSAGPRNCVGYSYAMIAMLTILSAILRKYRIESVEQRDKVVLLMGITCKAAKPFHIRKFEINKFAKP